MKKTAIFAFALFLLLPAPILAVSEATDLDEVIKALEAPFNPENRSIEDFQADFLQESLIASLDRAQGGKGKVSVKFDRTRDASRTMFRWEYRQPTNQEIVSNGKTMWVYLPENSQVIISDIDPSPSNPNDPMTFLTGLGTLSRDFRIGWGTPRRDGVENYILELQPRRPSSMIQRMVIVVDKNAVRPAGRKGAAAAFPIVSTTVFDPSGNSTRIEFMDVRVNLGLSDSLFKFVPPEGVEVLRPTGSELGF